MGSEKHDFTSPSEKVTFGSLVNLNFEDDFSLYMYGDGYIESKIYMKKFVENKEQLTKQDDFSNCIFMILPFPNMDSFQHQKNFVEIIKKDIELTNKNQSKLRTPRAQPRTITGQRTTTHTHHHYYRAQQRTTTHHNTHNHAPTQLLVSRESTQSCMQASRLASTSLYLLQAGLQVPPPHCFCISYSGIVPFRLEGEARGGAGPMSLSCFGFCGTPGGPAEQATLL